MTSLEIEASFFLDFCYPEERSDIIKGLLKKSGFSFRHQIDRFDCFDRPATVFEQHPKWRVFDWPYRWLP